MEKLVTLYHGGEVRRNDIGGVNLENMHELSVLFSCRPTFNGILDKVNEKLRWTGEASPNGWPMDLNNLPVFGSPVVDDADDEVGHVKVVPSEVILTQVDGGVDLDEGRYALAMRILDTTR